MATARMNMELITNGMLVLIALAVIWALWRAGQPRAVFTVRIRGGQVQAAEGMVTAAFLERIREVAAANEISRGVVRGYAHGTFIRLRFSAEITEPACQQLRNWWATFGWAAPRTVTRGCA